jgi:iron complex outermembrane receptor protein
VFQQSITDFQNNSFFGTGYKLVNAGKESVKGFEFDGAYQVFKPLTINLNVTYLDAKYDSYTAAPCSAYDVANCGAGQISRDLSGKRPGGIPPWSVSTWAVYTQDFGGGYAGFARAEYDFASRQSLSDTVDPLYDSVTVNQVNASLGFTTPYKLDITLWVRNLTNDATLLSAFPATLQTGSYNGYPSEPRRYGITIRKTF